MLFWLTSTSADFESGKSIKNDQITDPLIYVFLAATRCSPQPFPALQAHLSCIRQ
jgi:hypothetical protein